MSRPLLVLALACLAASPAPAAAPPAAGPNVPPEVEYLPDLP